MSLRQRPRSISPARSLLLRTLPLVLFACPAMSEARLRLPSLFSDHMVLQQSSTVNVFGWADAGERVTVAPSWGSPVTVTANAGGRWLAAIPTIRPGGPHTLTVRTPRESKTFKDVLLGEVWVASGQSNMEWPLQIWPGGTAVEGAAEAIAASARPQLRFFHVPREQSTTPQTDVPGRWQVSDPAIMTYTTAVGYFFAVRLQEVLGVPVGIIQSAYGGTEIERWMSPQAVSRIPGVSSAEERATRRREAQAAYVQVANAADPTRGDFARAEFDDSAWAPAQPGPLPDDFDGLVLYRATVTLTEAQARRNAVLHLGPVDDDDETWVNGRLVGVTNVHDQARAYPVPEAILRPGANTIAIRVIDRQMAGGFTSPDLIRLQIGNDQVPLTGWKRLLGPTIDKITALPAMPNVSSSTLWNAMVHPLVPYSLRGAIWYQGESNVGRAVQYRHAFTEMVRDWRRAWGQGDFPFYFVQIAPWSGYGGGGLSAELRESQRLALQLLSNSGMVVTTDLAPDPDDIHPAPKRPVGERLANLALVKTYRRSTHAGRQLYPSGPLFDGFVKEGATIRLRFDFAQGGLKSNPDPQNVAGFTIAGADRVFKPARAEIRGEFVLVSSPEVPDPVAVRYGWSDTPAASLFNQGGLPASPFRTDDWPLITQNVSW